ncbi:MAG: HAD family phosphatase [Eubacteriaceae bacterium]|uniref:HAD family phosphatase n=1 Tax=Candidatus Pseudoramibacter fermentans TaxID=2594427 RepID=A0A6L5GTJ0_9FIRM|nr:HAD family phosphatase [Candidatus Pseudoramibacter fermentans]RRF92682.1 MAG: HAD family phosphatase [Eubacteriaceae bacterium]
MKPKLLAFDLDGTLLTTDKTISPRTLEVLIAFQRAGGRVAIASARPAVGTAVYSRMLKLADYHGLVIAYNGAQIVDQTTQQVIFEKQMDPDTARAFIRNAERFPVSVLVDDGRTYFSNDPDGYKVEHQRSVIGIPIEKHVPLADFVDFPLCKILVMGHGDVLDRVTPEITAPFADVFDFFRVGEYYLEVTFKGFSKASGLKAIENRLGISRAEMIAFGDSQNDAGMLAYAGIGAAMRNGEAPAKAAADVVTAYDNDHDGIAHFLTENPAVDLEMIDF